MFVCLLDYAYGVGKIIKQGGKVVCLVGSIGKIGFLYKWKTTLNLSYCIKTSTPEN